MSCKTPKFYILLRKGISGLSLCRTTPETGSHLFTEEQVLERMGGHTLNFLIFDVSTAKQVETVRRISK